MYMNNKQRKISIYICTFLSLLQVHIIIHYVRTNSFIKQMLISFIALPLKTLQMQQFHLVIVCMHYMLKYSYRLANPTAPTTDHSWR